VDPPRLRVHHRGQGVDVGRLELRDAAVREDLGRQLVRPGERREGVHVGGVALLDLPSLRELELVEENDLQLPGRVDVEALPGQPVDLLLRPGQEALELPRHLPETPLVDQDPPLLHGGQHLHERHLHVPVEIPEARLPNPLPREGTDRQGRLGAFARIGGHGRRVHVGGREGP